MMLVATAVLASETIAEISFLERLLCKNLLCRLHQLGTLAKIVFEDNAISSQ